VWANPVITFSTLRRAAGLSTDHFLSTPFAAEQRGHPKIVKSSAQSHDEDLQRRLWTVSEELTGVSVGVCGPIMAGCGQSTNISVLYRE
jgi:hypothetical protein